jgi:coiled-coil domain-containing protein 12
MSSHETLAAAANDRKSRLAHLKSLKRKQAPAEDESTALSETPASPSTALTLTEPSESEVTKSYLSGRNFDPETRNVKLGFENAPIGDQKKTLEYRAEQLALESKAQQAQEEADDKGLDLFKLQPKRPNWDLKRDLERKMEGLNTLTENAIAKIVRERVEGQKKAASGRIESAGREGQEAQEVGMEGSELVEAMHLKEREEEAERKRDEEEEG